MNIVTILLYNFRFKKSQLNLVFGFQLLVAWLGHTINFVLMDDLYDYIKTHITDTNSRALGTSFLLSGITCILSFLCSLLLALKDRRIGFTERREGGDLARILDVKDFQISFWFLSFACMTYFGATFAFVSLGQNFLTDGFHLSKEDANNIVGLVFFISALVSPWLGLLLDKMGKNITCLASALLVSGGCHLILAFYSRGLPLEIMYLQMVMMGLAFSLVTIAIWPIASIACQIPDKMLCTAYGLMQAALNFGTAVSSLAAYSIQHKFDGYEEMEVRSVEYLQESFKLSPSTSGLLRFPPGCLPGLHCCHLGARLSHQGRPQPHSSTDRDTDRSQASKQLVSVFYLGCKIASLSVFKECLS